MSENKVPQIIIDLVEKFKQNEHQYTNPQVFDEENTKTEFINPFFKALGWDVYNEKGKAPQYKEVVFEDSIKIGGKTKAPDYSFRLGGQRIFFVEAKKPSVDIEKSKSSALQVRRYGWSAGLKLCILTDFEQLSIYDTTIKPERNHDVKIGKIAYYKYTDYIEKWDEIYNIFSKEAVEKGSFDNFADGHTGTKKGTSEVDQEFLKEIDNWRILLARNIALRNEDKSVEEINYAVQLIIDRIIFLRIAEDRGIEKYGQLKKLLDLSNSDKEDYPVYKGFLELCNKADLKYNSGLFHFKEEKEISHDPDKITPTLNIDDGIFKTIFKNLYYPNCPYEFSVISTEILGSVYERFLGKIIRLTPSHKAKVEDKPEVKKAGGVYYTPNYIVHYIVKNSVGKLINGLTPNKISDIKIIDPACGSGSFLLEAYQQLLDYHLNYYTNQEKPPKNVIYQGKDKEWRLTIQEKKRILLNNIFGVDLDSNAVEVTKLSLLLKVLEDENKDVIEQQQKLFQERVLPNLGNNIKCGNSLIGFDFEDEDLTREQIRNIHPFNWETEFPEVFARGGFDAVVGNPPYVKIHNIDKLSLSYYFDTYKSAEKKCDLYSFFVEKSLTSLLKPKGVLGFIISNTWLNLDSFTNLREIISIKNTLKNLTLVKNPFKNVSVAPVIFFVENMKKEKYKFEVSRFEENKIISSYYIDSSTIKKENSYIIDVNATPEALKILEKINQNSYKLVELSELYYGIMTANNKKFIISEKTEKWHKPLLRGKDIKRYFIDYNGDIFVDYRPNEMKKKKTARPGSVERFEVDEKIVFQRYSSTQIIATIDRNKFYTLGTTIICVSNSEYSNTFLLGLINSKLLNWWYGRVFTSPTNYIREFEAIPIIKLDMENSIDRIHYDKLSSLVEKILELKIELINVNLPNDKKIIENQIDIIDNKINQLVYELYDLTDEEIMIIENSLVN